MRVLGPYEKARLYIQTHTEQTTGEIIKNKRDKPGPCLTISREAGISTEKISEELVEYLSRLAPPGNSWGYFDRALIEKVLKDHALPDRMDKFMVEEKFSTLNTMLNELLGLQPPILKLLHKTTKTILQLAQLGNVIIVGRASNIITAHLPNSFHVRLVAPLNYRIELMTKDNKLLKSEASKLIKKEDKSRELYVSRNFHKNINDPYLYDIIVNLSLMNRESLIKTIGHSAALRFNYIK